MNTSQMNLYEIIDALEVSVKIGDGVFEIPNRLEIDNGVIYAQLDIDGLYIHELASSMWMIMRIGDLGIIGKAKNGALEGFVFFDLSHPIPEFYLSTKDYTALLTHMSNDRWKNDFIVRLVKC